MQTIHEPERQRFVITVDGQESVLEYRPIGTDSVDFVRTFVPTELRGRGIAEQLVRSGIAWAREQGLHMQATCWYARRFLDRGKTRD